VCASTRTHHTHTHAWKIEKSKNNNNQQAGEEEAAAAAAVVQTAKV